MSAFFVGTDHINAMLTAAKAMEMRVRPPGGEWAQYGLPDATWTAMGRELIEENMKSLAARYPDDWRQLLPDGFKIEDYVFEEDNYFITRHKITDAIHLANCYDYQSCEHDGWKVSWAYEFTHALLERAASKVPESGRCWEYHRPADAPQIVSLSKLARDVRTGRV